VLSALVEETGARTVFWSRAYDPDAIARDTEVKAALKAQGVEAKSFRGHVLHEPWTVETGQGGFYRVYTPFWRAVQGRDVPAPLPAATRLMAPDVWPASDDPAAWRLAAAMERGAGIVRPHFNIGEDAAEARLAEFIDRRIAEYAEARDLPGEPGTSRLSENLTYGEISAATCWHAGMRALHEGKTGAETFLKELVWRDFAYHLAFHTPRLVTGNWREEWDAFPWNEDETRPRSSPGSAAARASVSSMRRCGRCTSPATCTTGRA
jgi:deoxyribodipyrimidine photo-lyase